MADHYPEVLIINSYGGSLLLAAHNAQQYIVGSYEDSNYGMDIQRLNFSGVEFQPYRKDWPEKINLSDRVVLAHPPCAAFSQMTVRYKDSKTHGVDAEKFKCTMDVINYSMTNRAAAIMIESVTGALHGAWAVHERFANEHGYDVYRILQNGATFNTPQWRPRFWVVFVRKGVLNHDDNALRFRFSPKTKRVKDIVEMTGTVVDEGKRNIDLQRQVLEDHGINSTEVFDGTDGYGPIAAILRRRFKRRNEIHGDLPQITRKFCVRAPYMTNILRVLDPNGLAPVILSASWWALPSSNARELYHEEYNNIMGYPHDYDWGKFKPKFREFLSRGVIPAVAQWILENVSANLVGRNGHGGAGELRKCFPGHIIDFSPPTKGSLLEAA